MVQVLDVRTPVVSQLPLVPALNEVGRGIGVSGVGGVGRVVGSLRDEKTLNPKTLKL
jgi:hypothetical protein